MKIVYKLHNHCMCLYRRAMTVMRDNRGDQITGWLIVILLVVVVGAFFLNTYQGSIIEIWNDIVDKMRDVFEL